MHAHPDRSSWVELLATTTGLPVASQAGSALAAGVALTPQLVSDALADLRLIFPCAPHLAARCCQHLLDCDRLAPATRADVWLLLAEIHALRCDGAATRTAVEAARALLRNASAGLKLAWCDLYEGMALAALGRFPDSHRLLEAAHHACHRYGDARGGAWAALALAHHHAELGRLPKAETWIAEALSVAADMPWLAWRAQVQATDLRIHRAQYAGADLAYAALAQRGEAAGWNFDCAHVRLMQGLVAVQQGAFAEAERYLVAAETVYRADGSAYYLGVCRRAFASLYRGLGRYDEALVAASAALETFQALGHELAVARCYHMLALTHHSRNAYAEALHGYREAGVRFAAAGHRQGMLVMTLNQAIIEEARGHYHAALNSYERVLADGRRLRLIGAAGHCHHRIAVLSGRLGLYPEAEAHFRLARRAHGRAGALLEAHTCMVGQAGLLHLMGRRTQARRLLARARRYFAATQRAAALTFCEQTSARMLADEGQHRRALARFQMALEQLEASGQAIDAALCQLEMGEVYLAAGQPAQALAVLTAAASRLSGFPDAVARAEHALGHAASSLEQLQEAVAHWQRAVDCATVARRGIVTESHGGSFFAAHRRVYEDALEGWLALNEPAQALAVVEVSKGQVLAGLLQQRDIASAAFLQQTPQVQALWEQAGQVAREMHALQARWPALDAGRTRGLLPLEVFKADAGDDVASRLAALAARQSALFERIRRSAASFEVLDPVQPFALDRLRAVADATWGPDWRALAYYLRPDSVVIFWIGGKSVRAWVRPLSRLDRAKLSRAVDPDPEQREVTYAGRLRGVPQPQPPGPRLLADLARLLLPDDVLPELAGNRHVLIAPHGLLHYLPFHALRPGGGPPLLARVILSYAPSLRVWEALATAALAVGAGERIGNALVVGIEDFGGRVPGLAFAQAEAHDVAERLGSRARLLQGGAATRERLLGWSDDGTLAGYDIIHLATHALFDGAHPLRSGVLLADAALAVPDLFRLRLNARLVALSACQTALSRLEPGDELLGLREALLFAGARALLVSLWQVDDAATGRLMAHFYDRLLTGARPAAALAAAQRMLYDEGEPAFNWAPFVVVG